MSQRYVKKVRNERWLMENELEATRLREREGRRRVGELQVMVVAIQVYWSTNI